jgi:hypothetical protein
MLIHFRELKIIFISFELNNIHVVTVGRIFLSRKNEKDKNTPIPISASIYIQVFFLVSKPALHDQNSHPLGVFILLNNFLFSSHRRPHFSIQFFHLSKSTVQLRLAFKVECQLAQPIPSRYWLVAIGINPAYRLFSGWESGFNPRGLVQNLTCNLQCKRWRDYEGQI